MKSTPPPLVHSPTTSDRGRESTAESTPINTPVSAVATTFGATSSRARRGKDLYFSWHKKPAEDSNPTFFESDILFEDDASADACFPLFPDSPPLAAARGMDGAPAAPIDISTPPRFSSQSPRNQQSNLTFALQEAGAIADQQPSAAVAAGSNSHIAGARNGNDGRLSVSGRQDSVSNGMNPSSFYGSGARQIPGVRERPRRESVAGSFANGMSWGGISVGSWVRDE
ncbi:MAG: hypothetical protein INR71_15790 [Terriglobus roseus]|nr:hypothetical protein [Terriglobus roseus]